MWLEFGCHGQIDVGQLPDNVVSELERLSGDWLEYDRDLGAIVVRYVEPPSTQIVPAVTSELVHMLATIPFELQEQLAGGQFLVHTEGVGRLVRITVEPGGALHVEWAHPNYAGSEKRPFQRESIRIEPYEQRLTGHITFTSDDPNRAAGALQELADTFEGLYPEGDFRSLHIGDGTVEVTMKDVNLDVGQLLDTLNAHAQTGTRQGTIAVGSFKDAVPEHMLRLVFEEDELWMQQPLLWE
jgi:hypothetical protein